MDSVLDIVRHSLSDDAMQVESNLPGATGATEGRQEERLFLEDDNTWDYDANEVEFDDVGQGAGVEGDLEDNED